MKARSTMCTMAAAALVCGFAGVPSAMADTDMTETWTISEGGKLYDHWSTVLFREVKDVQTHPSYPKSGKQKGEATWRCKECHGWDYKGKDGAYGKGSHFTGIKGLRDVVGVAPEKIANVIRDKTHRYTEAMIPDKAAMALAMFVSRGQYDVEQFLLLLYQWGGVRANTKLLTRAAPKRLKVAASSFSVLPLVITSSTIPMCCPRTIASQPFRYSPCGWVMATG